MSRDAKAVVLERYRDVEAATERFVDIGHVMKPALATAAVCHASRDKGALTLVQVDLQARLAPFGGNRSRRDIMQLIQDAFNVSCEYVLCCLEGPQNLLSRTQIAFGGSQALDDKSLMGDLQRPG